MLAGCAGLVVSVGCLVKGDKKRHGYVKHGVDALSNEIVPFISTWPSRSLYILRVRVSGLNASTTGYEYNAARHSRHDNGIYCYGRIHHSHSPMEIHVLVVFQIALLTTQTTHPPTPPKSSSISHASQSNEIRRLSIPIPQNKPPFKSNHHKTKTKHGTENYPVIQGQRPNQIKSKKNIQTTRLFARYHQTKKEKKKKTPRSITSKICAKSPHARNPIPIVQSSSHHGMSA